MQALLQVCQKALQDLPAHKDRIPAAEELFIRDSTVWFVREPDKSQVLGMQLPSTSSEQLFLDLLHHITRRRRWLLRPRSVQVGETQDGRVEIRAGLAEGETLVVPPR